MKTNRILSILLIGIIVLSVTACKDNNILTGGKDMNEQAKKINQPPESYTPQKPEIVGMAKKALDETIYPESFILPDKSTKIPPQIKHYGPAYVSFSNAFSHLLDYSGQGYGFIFEGDWCKDRSYTIAEVISGHAIQPTVLNISPEEQKILWNTAGFPYYHTFYADSEKGDYLSETEMKCLYSVYPGHLLMPMPQVRLQPL